jgi:NTP pyrophosphatase (non-canonical NTP hydrolase)
VATPLATISYSKTDPISYPQQSGEAINRRDFEMQNDLASLRDLVRQFADERDWDKFHTPKNLATALSVEASELLEPFQWLTSGEKSELDEGKQTAVRHEMADVLLYLVRLADKLDVDLYQACLEKIEINRAKYPAEKVRGDSRKYSDYQD